MLFKRKPATTVLPPETLPANPSLGGRVAAGGNAIASKATQIYKNHPKVVGGLALLASALVLNRMKRPPV